MSSRYERTGEFRAPRKGEWYEAHDKFRSPVQAHGGHAAYDPRWILREVKEETRPGTEQVITRLVSAFWPCGPDTEAIVAEARRRVRVVGKLVVEIEAAKRAQMYVPEWVENILGGEGV